MTSWRRDEVQTEFMMDLRRYLEQTNEESLTEENWGRSSTWPVNNACLEMGISAKSRLTAAQHLYNSNIQRFWWRLSTINVNSLYCFTMTSIFREYVYLSTFPPNQGWGLPRLRMESEVEILLPSKTYSNAIIFLQRSSRDYLPD